jgi:methylenetetrahydrofolate dehydrogenase (NADP+)/methenyltetrahydrofolate cyclohydrolase
MKIIDGRALAEQLTTKLTQEIHSGHLQINLAVVLVGKDPASQLYTRLKKQACEKAGINFHLYQLPEDTTTEAVLEVINFLNHDQEINAILDCKSPFPKQSGYKKIIEAIDPPKDADGLSPV